MDRSLHGQNGMVDIHKTTCVLEFVVIMVYGRMIGAQHQGLLSALPRRLVILQHLLVELLNALQI